jgi:hypothetical protein
VEAQSWTNWRRKDAAAVNHLVAVKSSVGGGGGRRRDGALVLARGGEGAERFGLGKWVWGSETPTGVGMGRGNSISAESSPAHLRSSNRDSQPGRAEMLFSVEVGTAHTCGPG